MVYHLYILPGFQLGFPVAWFYVYIHTHTRTRHLGCSNTQVDNTIIMLQAYHTRPFLTGPIYTYTIYIIYNLYIIHK
jgi:hypothetical protein